MITIGGAGSGKLRDLLAYVVCKTPNARALILDPRGELGAISQHIHAAYRDYAYFWSPLALLGLPQHGCNPLDILDETSEHFHADCKFIAEGLIPFSGAGSSKYFELRAREWLEGILKSRIEQNAAASLPDLFRTINSIEADPESWTTQLEIMLKSKFEGVRRTAGESSDRPANSSS